MLMFGGTGDCERNPNKLLQRDASTASFLSIILAAVVGGCSLGAAEQRP
ncbi:MAG: hypothetical protein H0T92_18995 [Pyrinomonadaceae bacterium]|jgi:hypothetical protein|nr:hypothetical protein [Pyrinomonadaceae bacterium]